MIIKTITGEEIVSEYHLCVFLINGLAGAIGCRAGNKTNIFTNRNPARIVKKKRF